MLDKDSSYQELAARMKELKDGIATNDEASRTLKNELERITLNLLPEKMDAEGVSTVNVKGYGRITITQQMRANVPADRAPELRQWLRDNGYEGLIAETVNSSTLKSWVKERIAECEDYPADLINLYTFEQATLTKA